MLPTNRSMPPADVIPELGYDDVRAAARWLADAFGFRERLRIGDHRIQMQAGNGYFVVGGAERKASPAHASVMVRVANADEHCAHARRHGATIVNEPQSYPFGERQYTAEDLAGYRWTFSQTIDDVDPASWGGELVSDG